MKIRVGEVEISQALERAQEPWHSLCISEEIVLAKVEILEASESKQRRR